jgi:hypothetical protein
MDPVSPAIFDPHFGRFISKLRAMTGAGHGH